MAARRHTVGRFTQAGYAEPLESSSAVRELVVAATEPAILHEPDGTVVDFNDQACAMLGYSHDRMKELAPYGWVGLPAQPGAAGRLESILHDGVLEFASIAICCDGSLLSTAVTARRIDTVQGPLVFATFSNVVSCPDGDPLTCSGDHDELTALPNAFAFGVILEGHLRQSRESNGTLLVGCLDLSEFATLHETFGHDASNTVLVETARRLVEAIGAQGRVARTGWDDFCFFLLDRDAGSASEVAERLLAAIHAPVVIDGQVIEPDACIGFADAGEGAPDARCLMVKADIAMHEAKQGNARQWLVYNENMGTIEPQRD